MVWFFALGMGARAAVVAAGAVFAGGVGYAVWSGNQAAVPGAAALTAAPALAQNPAPAQVELAAAEPAPALPDAAAVQAGEAAVGQETLTAQAQPAPTFDLIRVEPDGQALVAGRAAPGSKIMLRLDGAEISGTSADANGDFVVLFVLDPSTVPRLLTLGSMLSGEGEVSAAAEVALAPTAAPVVVAQAMVTSAPDAVLPVPAALPANDSAITAAISPAPATSAPPALLVTKDGVNILQTGDQPVAQAGAGDLALDTISYTPAGEVQLAGRAGVGTVVRIYLDNAPLMEMTVSDDGRWASAMPQIAPGIYTLRVDALAGDGTVVARFETPFKRETAAALAAASQGPAVVADTALAAPDQLASAGDAVPAAPADPAPAAEMIAPPNSSDEQALVTADAAADPATAPVQVAADAATGTPATVAQRPLSITVQPGFTLWGIASQQFGEGVMYVQVFEANKDRIRDPDLIYPGQVFVIPAGSD